MRPHLLLAARVAAFYKGHKALIPPGEFSLVVDAVIRVLAREGEHPDFLDPVMIPGIKSEACRILGRHGGLVSAKNRKVGKYVDLMEKEPAIVWAPKDGWLFNPATLRA